MTFARLRAADWVALVAAPTRAGEPELRGLAAAGTALLVLYRVIQEPGFDALTTVQAGAPLALGLLGVLAFACSVAVRAEEEGDELRQVDPAPAP